MINFKKTVLVKMTCAMERSYRMRLLGCAWRAIHVLVAQVTGSGESNTENLLYKNLPFLLEEFVATLKLVGCQGLAEGKDRAMRVAGEEYARWNSHLSSSGRRREPSNTENTDDVYINIEQSPWLMSAVDDMPNMTPMTSSGSGSRIISSPQMLMEQILHLLHFSSQRVNFCKVICEEPWLMFLLEGAGIGPMCPVGVPGNIKLRFLRLLRKVLVFAKCQETSREAVLRLVDLCGNTLDVAADSEMTTLEDQWTGMSQNFEKNQQIFCRV
mmetsp:Transcript_40145/g.94375  ORF Transcript_40145/g.94375 Transcript_40145/m.94375 type:complete len:270 (-) Transcript_40145:8521-9330(-)